MVPGAPFVHYRSREGTRQRHYFGIGRRPIARKDLLQPERYPAGFHLRRVVEGLPIRTLTIAAR